MMFVYGISKHSSWTPRSTIRRGKVEEKTRDIRGNIEDGGFKKPRSAPRGLHSTPTRRSDLALTVPRPPLLIIQGTATLGTWPLIL